MGKGDRGVGGGGRLIEVVGEDRLEPHVLLNSVR